MSETVTVIELELDAEARKIIADPRELTRRNHELIRQIIADVSKVANHTKHLTDEQLLAVDRAFALLTTARRCGGDVSSAELTAATDGTMTLQLLTQMINTRLRSINSPDILKKRKLKRGTYYRLQAKPI